MILCDIGNTHYHFYDEGRLWKAPVKGKAALPQPGLRSFYYVSVNEPAARRLEQEVPGAVNLAPYVSLDTEYRGLGIDRAVACNGLADGVIVDAGSAITVDIMQNGLHLGGFIIPGLGRLQETYAHISPALQKSLNFNVDPESLPQNTTDAISFGIIASIVCIIEKKAKNKKLFFTGGDGAFLARFFPDAVVDNTLVFRGMQNIIKKRNLR